MATFAKLAVWPVGYFRAFSSWLLRNRRDIGARLEAINAEIDRIGFVRVIYMREKDADNNEVATENRTGFQVSEGTTLARLVQAYIANGGNPLDISGFLMPDTTENVGIDINEDSQLDEKDEVRREHYPGGGIVAPVSANYDNPAHETDDTGYGTYRGGWLNTDRYYVKRQGGNIDRGGFDGDLVVLSMRKMRDWANQEIKERLQDIEWRIVKQMDLREQLTIERDKVLVQAFGGALDSLLAFDQDRMVPGQRVQVLVQDYYGKLFKTLPDGTVQSWEANDDTVPFLGFTFEDVVSEKHRHPLGG